jgi:hypothetical protein
LFDLPRREPVARSFSLDMRNMIVRRTIVNAAARHPCMGRMP